MPNLYGLVGPSSSVFSIQINGLRFLAPNRTRTSPPVARVGPLRVGSKSGPSRARGVRPWGSSCPARASGAMGRPGAGVSTSRGPLCPALAHPAPRDTCNVTLLPHEQSVIVYGTLADASFLVAVMLIVAAYFFSACSISTTLPLNCLMN